MKVRYLTVALILIFFLGTNALAIDRKKLGIGVIVGEPTGFTGKYMFDNSHAIDAGIGWELSGDNDLHVYADYLYHLNDIIKVTRGVMPLYIGAGGRFVDRDKKDNKFGLRFPVGVEYIFENPSFGAFLELAPVVDLAPDTDLELEGGIGIRYFF